MPTATNSPSRDWPSSPPILGWLDRRDFAVAQRCAPSFAVWKDYREFIAERDALLLGYGASGLTAKRQRVGFGAFQSWARLTGAPIDIDGLDVFAAHRRWRLSHPNAPVIGRFGAPDDPERWPPAEAGVQCLRVRPEVFVRWRDEFAQAGLIEAPDIDGYAAYVVELCLSPDSGARRPLVNSA